MITHTVHTQQLIIGPKYGQIYFVKDILSKRWPVCNANKAAIPTNHQLSAAANMTSNIFVQSDTCQTSDGKLTTSHRFLSGVCWVIYLLQIHTMPEPEEDSDCVNIWETRTISQAMFPCLWHYTCTLDTYKYICVCVCVCLYACLYVCMYARICVCVCVHMYMGRYVYVYWHVFCYTL